MLTIEDAIKDLIEAIGAEITTAIRAIATDPKVHAMMVDAAIAEMKAQHEHHQARRKSAAADVAAFDSEATGALTAKPPAQKPAISLVPPAAEKPEQGGAPLAAPPSPVAIRPAPSLKPAAVYPDREIQRLEDQWSQLRDDLLRDLYCQQCDEIPVIVGRLNQLPGANVNSGAVHLRILYLQLKRGTALPTNIAHVPSLVADIHQIRHWAAPRGIAVDTADDIPKVNRERQRHGLPAFALHPNTRSATSP